MSKESKQTLGQATPREPKDLKIAHDDFVLVKDREGLLRKQKSLQELMEQYASKDLDTHPDKVTTSVENLEGMKMRARAESKKVSMTPPSFNCTPGMRHSFYFRVINSLITAEAITVGDLIAIAGGIGTITNSTISTVHSSVRLKSVTIWSSTSDSNLTNPEVAFQATGGVGYIPDKDRSRAIPSGVTVGGGMKWTVPKDAIAYNWMSSSLFASEVFTIYDTPVGSVIRVEGEWCQRNALAGVTRTGFATVSIGSMYYDYLDGNTAHRCLPIGVPNTF